MLALPDFQCVCASAVLLACASVRVFFHHDPASVRVVVCCVPRLQTFRVSSPSQWPQPCPWT
eukprot:3821813-Alexandrium_andersonii.AAC.1